MKLDIISEAETLDDCKAKAENYLSTILRIIREDLSIFEQYIVRPKEHKFIPEIWKYRIIHKNGTYYFGKTKL